MAVLEEGEDSAWPRTDTHPGCEILTGVYLPVSRVSWDVTLLALLLSLWDGLLQLQASWQQLSLQNAEKFIEGADFVEMSHI